MRRLLVGNCGLLLLAGLILSVAPSAGRTEPPKPQKVIFPSFDRVDLAGTFYPSSAEGTKSPCVMLLHKIGGNRDDGWEALAQALQEKGFAVLSFDFRGHGDSKNVRPEFWNLSRSNSNGMQAKAARKETIEYKNFLPNYYPMLVNDIAAAKVYLEQRHQARECNANEMMIVGAEEGASLGLVWLAAEWLRSKRFLNAQGMIVPYPDPEGRDVAALVALSIRPTLVPKVGVPLPALFRTPKLRETPMCFFVGKNDKVGAGFTNEIYGDKYLKADKSKLKSTFRIEFDNVNLAGHELLKQKSLGVDELVVRYLAEKIKEGRPGRVWTERDVPQEGRPGLNPLVQVPINLFGLVLP